MTDRLPCDVGRRFVRDDALGGLNWSARCPLPGPRILALTDRQGNVEWELHVCEPHMRVLLPKFDEARERRLRQARDAQQ
jgi:hypothetical protein